MDFIRKINKNVQESFSILNEGIQITNAILELKTVHLPILFQLNGYAKLNEDEGTVCCIFRDFLDGTLKGVNKTAENVSKSFEYGTKERLLSKLRLLKEEKDGFSEENSTVVKESGCALKENCLFLKFSADSYRESLEYVSFFMKTLDNVLHDSNRASRKIVEGQTFTVLYEISRLIEVTVFLKCNNEKLNRILSDVKDVNESLVNLVGFSLKLLNEILQYPISIYYNSIDRDYDDCKVEKKRYDCFLKRRFPAENIDEYELVNSFCMINLTEEERSEVDQYLYYLDTILNLSSNSRTFLDSLSLVFEEIGSEYNEVRVGIVEVFHKLFCYSDLNCHLSRVDDDFLYFFNRYYDHFVYFLYYNDHCYECTKPKMDPDLSVEGDYCSCFLTNQRCNFRVKLFLEDVLKNDSEFVRLLVRMVEVKEVYINTRVLNLLFHLSQIYFFIDILHKNGAFYHIFETLEDCFQEQFNLLGTNLNIVTYQCYYPMNILSLVDENDLKIMMTFPPCSIPSILLIHKYVVSSRWQLDTKYRSVLTNYTKSVMLVYTYYKCTYESSKSLEISKLLSQFLNMLLETSIFAQVALKDMAETDEIFVSHILKKLDVFDDSIEFGLFIESFDVDLFNRVISTLVILLNLTKTGVFVEFQVIQSVLNYLAISFQVLNYLNEKEPDYVVWVTSQTVSNLPDVYKYMLNVIYTRESMESEDTIKLKIEGLMEFSTPSLFHLCLTLLDPFINIRITNRFKQNVFHFASRLGLFSQDLTMGQNLNNYICKTCHELNSILNQNFDDGNLVLYKKFLHNYTSILNCNYTLEEFGQAPFFKQFNIGFLVQTVGKVVSLLEFQYGINLESILSFLLNYLIQFFFSVEFNSFNETLDCSPLFELLKVNNLSENFVMFKGISSVILFYLIILGRIPDEKVVGLDKMFENVNNLYRSNEFKASQVVLKSDDIQPIDTLGLDFEVVINSFLEKVMNTKRTDLLQIYFWNNNNYHNFSQPPQLFKSLIAFKFYIHPHIFEGLLRFLSSPSSHSLVTKPRNNEFFERKQVDDTLLDKPLVLLKTLYTGEIEFAREKMGILESQLHVIANSLQLTRMENKGLRNRIQLLEKELEGPSGQEDFNLELELEIERQRYARLEELYNQLLSQLNELTFSPDNVR